VRQTFETSSGTVEVVVDEASRTVAIYRFGGQRRVLAATMESWDHVDLVDVLARKIALAPEEAGHLAGEVRTANSGIGPPPPPPELPEELRRIKASSELIPAGVALRFVAVLLDAVIVLFPLSIVVGLLAGGGYSERRDGYATAGVNVAGTATLIFLALVLSYYVLCEAMTGMTLGKRMVGIRVVHEESDFVGFGAAVVRNLLRLIDGLFFYLVGAAFALTSPRGQRLGDRAAHTLVVRR
jgi:uncharacterized RDD family membrane protein YckC